jgi:hypothetical protein
LDPSVLTISGYEARQAAKKNRAAAADEMSDDELKPEAEIAGSTEEASKKPRLESGTGGDDTEIEETFNDGTGDGDRTATEPEPEPEAEPEPDEDEHDEPEQSARVVDPVPENRDLEGDRMSEDERRQSDDDLSDGEKDEEDNWSARQH